MQVHIWTFKDDVLLFNSANNLVRYIFIYYRKCMRLHRNSYVLMVLLHNLLMFMHRFRRYIGVKGFDVRIMGILMYI
jgi:hypothetical protein